MSSATLPGKDNAIAPTLYMVMELSNKTGTWCLGMVLKGVGDGSGGAIGSIGRGLKKGARIEGG